MSTISYAIGQTSNGERSYDIFSHMLSEVGNIPFGLLIGIMQQLI